MKNATSILHADSLTEDDVFDLEDAYLETVGNRPRDDRQGHFHPSSTLGCKRRNVYEYTRAPTYGNTDVDSQEVFDMGHAVHDLVGRKLHALDPTLRAKGLGYSLQLEVPRGADDQLFEDFGLGGTADGILEIWSDTWRQRSVLEIKSSKAERFDELKEPKKEHLLQAHLYAYRFDCPIMYLWYVNKNTSERKVYPVVFKQTLLMEALEYWQDCLRHADNGTLPPREESWYMCPRCEYRKVCSPPILVKIKNKNSKTQLSTIRKRGTL